MSMSYHSQSPLPKITPRELANLPEQRMEMFRLDKGAKPCGFGWLIVDDSNVVGNKVLLISQHTPVCIIFDHSAPYHDHMRAQILAQRYAADNPQYAAAPAEQLVITPLFQHHDAANDCDEEETSFPSVV